VSLLKSKFPQAKIRNIYASTEFGTLFVSDNERFIIDEKYSNFINISANNELMVHRSLVGDMAEGNEWFYTGDIVEKKSDDTLEIIGRKDDMVSVGGYIVNTIKIENILKDLDEIKDVQIKARKNKIIGNILIAEVIPN